MSIYQVVDSEGNVINSIVWDGVTPYTPPDGATLVKTTSAGIGDKIIDGKVLKEQTDEEGNKTWAESPLTIGEETD